MRPGDLEDRDLVARTLAGDGEAFGELVGRHQRSVYGIAFRTTGDGEVAQEIAQETFLRAFQALERFDLERPFSPWLYRIAANLSLKWRRRRRPEPLAAGHEGQRQQVGPTDLPSPEALVLAAERQARLWEAVAALPPDLRQVILLRHGEELSYREIASRLDIPLSSVKSRLFRARKRLRELLTEEMP